MDPAASMASGAWIDMMMVPSVDRLRSREAGLSRVWRRLRLDCPPVRCRGGGAGSGAAAAAASDVVVVAIDRVVEEGR